MNKKIFILLVSLMSLSLIGIVFVQSYWINTSMQNREEQFTLHATQILHETATKIEKQERNNYYYKLEKSIENLGALPDQTVISELFLVQRDSTTNETFMFRSGVVEEEFNISGTEFFDINSDDSVTVKRYYGQSETTYFDKLGLDEQKVTLQERIERVNELPEYDQLQLEEIFHTIASKTPIHKRLSTKQINLILAQELYRASLDLAYEFAVYNNGLATSLRSENYELLKEKHYAVGIFEDTATDNFSLRITFPDEKKYLLSSILPMVILSIALTLIVIFVFTFVLYQLVEQRKIAEIKADFINNMTHEFKTPIATINLALDAIINPKIMSNSEKVTRYLGIIKDENKRMHAQVENVLRISQLEKKELNISKEKHDIHDLIEDAIPHIELLVENRGGYVKTHFNAEKTTVLVNESHFTNVLVNVLDNAIKYSTEAPEIDVFTTTENNSIAVKIVDKGVGMSKAVQKKIFEKFYREHTGNVHNVKGHGLGLAYVKQIVDYHNGTLIVTSEQGVGTTFIIKLPLTS